MRSGLIISLIFILSVFLAACGGNAAGNNTTTHTNGTSSNVVTNSGGNVVNAEGQPAGISIPGQSNSEPNINTPPAGNIGDQGKRQVVEGPPPPPGTKPVTVVGGEGSEILTTMGAGGSFVETRTFLNKTSLVAKLQRTTNGSDVSAKLFLRSGKVVDIAPDKIKDFRMMSSIELMSGAGLKVPVAPTPKPVEPVDPNSTTKPKH